VSRLTRRVTIGALATFAIAGLTPAATASASELPVHYEYHTHCNKTGWWIWPSTKVFYEWDYSNRAGYFQEYRSYQNVPNPMPFEPPLTNTYWIVVTCG
jgi:hypothetical protein